MFTKENWVHLLSVLYNFDFDYGYDYDFDFSYMFVIIRLNIHFFMIFQFTAVIYTSWELFNNTFIMSEKVSGCIFALKAILKTCNLNIGKVTIRQWSKGAKKYKPDSTPSFWCVKWIAYRITQHWSICFQQVSYRVCENLDLINRFENFIYECFDGRWSIILCCWLMLRFWFIFSTSSKSSQ